MGQKKIYPASLGAGLLQNLIENQKDCTNNEALIYERKNLLEILKNLSESLYDEIHKDDTYYNLIDDLEKNGLIILKDKDVAKKDREYYLNIDRARNNKDFGLLSFLESQNENILKTAEKMNHGDMFWEVKEISDFSCSILKSLNEIQNNISSGKKPEISKEFGLMLSQGYRIKERFCAKYKF